MRCFHCLDPVLVNIISRAHRLLITGELNDEKLGAWLVTHAGLIGEIVPIIIKITIIQHFYYLNNLMHVIY
jgi:hypothetical protein